jgi:hypothetical protein
MDEQTLKQALELMQSTKVWTNIKRGLEVTVSTKPYFFAKVNGKKANQLTDDDLAHIQGLIRKQYYGNTQKDIKMEMTETDDGYRLYRDINYEKSNVSACLMN